MYERVTETQVPESHHLKNPVVEKIPMVSEVQEHGLYNLQVGNYIICGEVVVNGDIFQTNCFQTVVRHLETKSCE